MEMKIHKKVTEVSTRCGINLFSTKNGLRLTNHWRLVTCKKCLAKLLKYPMGKRLQKSK